MENVSADIRPYLPGGAEGEASVTNFEKGLQTLLVNEKLEMIKLGLY